MESMESMESTRKPNFIGHSIPGVIYCFLGVWTAYNLWLRWAVCRRLAQSRRRVKLPPSSAPPEEHGSPQSPWDSSQYRNSILFSFSCCRSRPVVSELLIIAMCLVGIVVEAATPGWNADGTLDLHPAHHITIYGTFLSLPTLVMLRRRGAPLPEGLEYICFAFGFAIQGFIFSYHTPGRAPLDSRMHYCVVYLCELSCGTLLWEMACRGNVLAGLCRAVSIIMQGTWSFQLGWTLYPPLGGPPPPVGGPHHLMFATLLFAWHAVFAAAVVGVLGVVACRGAALMGDTELSDWIQMEKTLIGSHKRSLKCWDEHKDKGNKYIPLDASEDEA